MRNWPETQATVISSDLKSYSGDSTTYEAVGLYQYQVAGQHYAGTRLGISGGADNVGDWHQRMSGKLRSARSTQSTMRIYYNPGKPSESIVDRSPRWPLLGFKMIFCPGIRRRRCRLVLLVDARSQQTYRHTRRRRSTLAGP